MFGSVVADGNVQRVMWDVVWIEKAVSLSLHLMTSVKQGSLADERESLQVSSYGSALQHDGMKLDLPE